MKFRLIQQERRWYGVDALCRALGVTRGGYWSWVRRRPSRRHQGDAVLLSKIRAVHKTTRKKCYGSPRIHDELSKNGVRCGGKRIERLMRENSIRAKASRKYTPATTDSNHSLPVSGNILNRQFNQDKPNAAWVADTTSIRTREGWLYLAAVMDLFSRRIVGWSMGEHNDRFLVIRALDMAHQNRRPPKGIIFHSDRGSTYASEDFQKRLRSYGMVCSMSRKGCCYDNAVMESWFHSLKVEEIQDTVFETRRAAMNVIFQYMEVFYNRQRIHTTLGKMSPEEFEQQALRKHP